MPELQTASPQLSLATRLKCCLSEFCCPCELESRRPEKRNLIICNKRRVQLGETLYRMGDPQPFIFQIMFGSFKTSAAPGEGLEQVLGFYLPGEVLGLDGIGLALAPSSATAIEDSQVCVISFEVLEEQCGMNRTLQLQFHKAMAKEISTKQSLMLLLGQMTAEARVSYFLVNLGKRFCALGYSASDLNLRMTRSEIGSYLGMRLETVSRALSVLHESQLVNVDGKHIQILDGPGLARRLAGLGES